MSGKHFLIVGLGHRTGLHTANFLANKGFAVTVCDIKPHNELYDILQKLHPSVTVIAGNQDPEILNNHFDEIVLSPGVPQTIPLIQEAKKRGVRVISEIELAYRWANHRIIGITGTDGKSTTTMLTAHCLAALGFDAHFCGNIGIPYISVVEKLHNDSIAVIELSSYQLETIDTFKPDVAIFTNLTPDHLDRYDSMEDYFNAKMRITKNQQRDDYFIVNADDEFIATHLPPIQAKVLRFSLSMPCDCYCSNGLIFYHHDGKDILVADSKNFKILGVHNIQNAMAAVLASFAIANKMNVSIDVELLKQALYSFEGLPHRMQVVGEYQGRTFINDSKATTVGAVIMALKSIQGRIILLLGGRAKGDDYSRLKDYFADKVKALVLIGETKDEFANMFQSIRHVKADSMEDAVINAMKISAPGDTILLSPACASFDMYKNFEERGNHFTQIVKKLVQGELQWM